jgi:hypothetical protein
VIIENERNINSMIKKSKAEAEGNRSSWQIEETEEKRKGIFQSTFSDPL